MLASKRGPEPHVLDFDGRHHQPNGPARHLVIFGNQDRRAPTRRAPSTKSAVCPSDAFFQLNILSKIFRFNINMDLHGATLYQRLHIFSSYQGLIYHIFFNSVSFVIFRRGTWSLSAIKIGESQSGTSLSTVPSDRRLTFRSGNAQTLPVRRSTQTGRA